MKKFNNLRQEWQTLDHEAKEFFRAIAVFFIPIACFIMYMVSTNTYPRLDAKTTDKQTELKTSYELKGAYIKYAKRVYHEKYGN